MAHNHLGHAMALVQGKVVGLGPWGSPSPQGLITLCRAHRITLQTVHTHAALPHSAQSAALLRTRHWGCTQPCPQQQQYLSTCPAASLQDEPQYSAALHAGAALAGLGMGWPLLWQTVKVDAPNRATQAQQHTHTSTCERIPTTQSLVDGAQGTRQACCRTGCPAESPCLTFWQLPVEPCNQLHDTSGSPCNHQQLAAPPACTGQTGCNPCG